MKQTTTTDDLAFLAKISTYHFKAVKTLAYVLKSGTAGAWHGLVTVLSTRLSKQELKALALVVLEALDRDDASQVAEAVLYGGAGQPQPPLFSYMDQAAFWAEMAEPEEIEAYLIVTYGAMPRSRQVDFLNYVQKRRAA